MLPPPLPSLLHTPAEPLQTHLPSLLSCPAHQATALPPPKPHHPATPRHATPSAAQRSAASPRCDSHASGGRGGALPLLGLKRAQRRFDLRERREGRRGRAGGPSLFLSRTAGVRRRRRRSRYCTVGARRRELPSCDGAFLRVSVVEAWNRQGGYEVQWMDERRACCLVSSLQDQEQDQDRVTAQRGDGVRRQNAATREAEVGKEEAVLYPYPYSSPSPTLTPEHGRGVAALSPTDAFPPSPLPHEGMNARRLGVRVRAPATTMV
ncbi:hypothetical protein HDK90DRAFT_229561 [Phyllosticta capitalensis]|uniref:Uncharacterized protein n=1 Tax=Phyllosticta capitalensis TaxID=121624 RepID=A0ABR1YVG6_9PEZI